MTLKQLDTLEIGTCVVVILHSGIRCPSLYAGKDEDGYYTFYDETVFKYSKQYIEDRKVKIIEPEDDLDLCKCMKLVNKVMRGGVAL